MAANSSCRKLTTFGKRLLTQSVTQSGSAHFISAAVPLLRRWLHSSIYDKNIDDQICPVVIPDDVIQPQSDKYWAPNPNTGVFGPATAEQNTARAMGGGIYVCSSHGGTGTESVLEQKAFIRPLEDLDKPHNT